MNMIIKVEAEEGEESLWLSGVTEKELNEMTPLLKEIKRNNGYFPTGKFRGEDDPKPEILYSGYPGWKSLVSRLPTPCSGIKRILEIHVYQEDPISLYM